MGGWARSIWFKRSMQTKDVYFAAEDTWDKLIEDHQVMVLSDCDGKVSVSTSNDTIEFDGAGAYIAGKET